MYYKIQIPSYVCILNLGGFEGNILLQNLFKKTIITTFSSISFMKVTTNIVWIDIFIVYYFYSIGNICHANDDQIFIVNGSSCILEKYALKPAGGDFAYVKLAPML